MKKILPPLAIVLLLGASASAQWTNVPSASVPRLPDGRVNMTAPAPRLPDGKPDQWYQDVAKSVYRPDIYLQAAKLLVAEGKAKKEDFPWDADGYRAPTKEFIDSIEYDGRKPNDYLAKLNIGLKGNQKLEGGNVVGK